MTEKITISIISHNHFFLIKKIINQLVLFREVSQIILTLNTSLDKKYLKDIKHHKLMIIKNDKSLGFGQNHNNAFSFCKTQYFCILNPDIIFIGNPFSLLLDIVMKNKNSIIAPVLINKDGSQQVTSRRFPSLSCLFLDYFFLRKRCNEDPNLHFNWLVGAFYVLHKDIFSELNGFDESFYLYCEDIDLCLRAKKNKYNLILNNDNKVIHLAQKDSHRKINYFFHHIKSLLKLYFNHYIKKNY